MPVNKKWCFRAFSEPSHHESVDRLLSCVFEQRLLASTEPLSEVLPAARLLSLPDEMKVRLMSVT